LFQFPLEGAGASVSGRVISRLDRVPAIEGLPGMDLHTFRQQLIDLTKMGVPVRNFTVTARIHCLDGAMMDLSGTDLVQKIHRLLGMIDSMTALERSYPFLMTVPGRCLRIAKGAGAEPAEVARFFTEFKAMSDAVIRLERSAWRKA
jgi:signal recognition particle GTPase